MCHFNLFGWALQFRKIEPRVDWATEGQGSRFFCSGLCSMWQLTFFSDLLVLSLLGQPEPSFNQKFRLGTRNCSAITWLHYCKAKYIQHTLNILFHHGKPIYSPFFLVCFALERRYMALVESVTLRLGPHNSYGGDFSYTHIYSQTQTEPYSSAFCLLGNSCSLLLLDHVPCHGGKLVCA